MKLSEYLQAHPEFKWMLPDGRFVYYDADDLWPWHVGTVEYHLYAHFDTLETLLVWLMTGVDVDLGERVKLEVM